MKFRSQRRSSADARSIGVRRLRMESLESRQLLSATPVMLTDSGSVTNTTSSNPRNFFEFDGKTFFVSHQTGVLWQTDGSAAGTIRTDSIPQFGSFDQVGESIVFKGSLYFSGQRTVNNAQNSLYRLDSGASSPQQVGAGIVGSPFFPQSFVAIDDWLYCLSPISSPSNPTGLVLWKTNGADADTQVVRVFQTSTSLVSSGLPSSEFRLENVNGTLLFKANDGVGGVELWKSDGTEGGTVLVKDIRPGSGSSIPNQDDDSWDNFVNIGGILYFTANDGTSGRELWRSDGTDGGYVSRR